MENQVVLLDTSILINFYRKKDKSKSSLYQLLKAHSSFAVSAITHYEIHIGALQLQHQFWDDFFSNMAILPFNQEISKAAVTINAKFKKLVSLLISMFCLSPLLR